jgi:hypothetical protein
MTSSNLEMHNDHTGQLPGDTGLMTVDPQGRPTRRFASPEGVYNVINQMLMSDTADAQKRAMIQGMIDGNPPYQQEELDKSGLGDMINLNWNGLRGSLESRLTAVDKLVGLNTRLVELSPKTPSVDPGGLEDIGDVIADQFSHAIHSWRGLPPLLEAAWRDSDAHGLGVAIQPQKNDFRPEPVPRGSLRTAENSVIDIDKNEVIAVEGVLDAGELFRILEKNTPGWEHDTVREYLIQTFVEGIDNTSQGGNKNGTTLVESFNAKVRDNVWYDTNQFKEIRVVHVYVREVEAGKGITHIIVPSNRVGTIGWLYYEEDVCENLSDVIWWLPAVSSADNRLRSLRGIASYLAPVSHLDNMLMCHAVDVGWRSSSLVLQATTKVDASTMRFVDYGPYTILPPELKVQGNVLPANGLDALLQLRQITQNVGQNNALGLKLSAGSPFPEGGQSGSSQAEVQAAQAAVLDADRHSTATRLRALASLFQNMFRRLVSIKPAKMPPAARKIAEEFRAACVARGVTEKQLDEVDEIFAINLSQELMLGGPMAFAQAMGALMQLRPNMDEEGGTRLMRDLMTPFVGRHRIDRYRPVINRENLSTSAKSLSQLENNSIIMGMAAVAGLDQQHKVHLAVHGEVIAQIMQGAQSGQLGDIAKASSTLQLALQHVFQHIQMLGSDPAFTDEARQMMADLKPAVQMAKELMQAAQQQAQMMAQNVMAQQKVAQEQATATSMLGSLDGVQLTPELMLEKYKIDKADQVSRLEQASLNKMRADKTVVQNQIRLAEAQAKLALDSMLAKSSQAARTVTDLPGETGFDY